MRVFLLLTAAALASAQTFTSRGFFETGALLYPQTAPNDSGRAAGDALLRYEAFYTVTPGFQFAAAADARTDTHRQTEREARVSWWDRERQRPAFEIRRLSAAYSRGKLTVEAGKQFIRWGKADVLNPTDRFAPRDFLGVVESEFLGVTAARVTYGGQSNTLDAVFSPRLTPSRIPLLNQRWSAAAVGIHVQEAPPDFPGGPQFGLRWNHIGQSLEYSFSFYNGYDNLPLFRGQPLPGGVIVQRLYPRMRMYGMDGAAPLRLVTFKWEAAYFGGRGGAADDYVIYVAQLERQTGEWSLTAGYAGEAVTSHGSAAGFSPLRGFTHSIVGRAGYTIDTNRSVAIEGVARQNGRGSWVRGEYSQTFGQHWRASAAVAWIRGEQGDFVGQFHSNSHAGLKLRYSF